MNQIEGRQISGLGDDEIKFLESCLIHSDDECLINQFSALPSLLDRDLNANDALPSLTEDQQEEILFIEENAKNKSTSQQTKYYANKFVDFLKSTKLPFDISTMPLRYLQSYLRLWFVKCRKENGNMYSTSTYCCMRAAIHRFLSETRDIKLIDNDEFIAFHRTYRAVLQTSLIKNKKYVSEGGSGYPEIESSDMIRLNEYFDRSDPTRLQDEVFFSICYFFGFRGREWLRDLTKDSVVLRKSPDGGDYIDLLKETAEKNVRAEKHHSVKQAIMTATPDNPSKCPVEALKIYLSKLPTQCLWPKPRKNWSDEHFFSDKQVLGKNTLMGMMKDISKRARLSCIYSNHSIRSTVVTNLQEKNHSVEDCQLVTGQKRKESVERYLKRKSFSQKQQISNSLTESLRGSFVEPSTSLTVDILSERSETINFTAPVQKKMKIIADGDNNKVQIIFE